MKNKAAQELGRLGGLKAAQNMTPEERKERASKAAKKRKFKRGGKTL